MAEPIRMCQGCRGRETVSVLVRLVWDAPGGAVVVDARRRLPGRGAHLHPRAECVQEALRRRAIPRALRRSLPADALERLLAGLAAPA